MKKNIYLVNEHLTVKLNQIQEQRKCAAFITYRASTNFNPLLLYQHSVLDRTQRETLVSFIFSFLSFAESKQGDGHKRPNIKN